jgi:hypothetical protein
MATAAAATPTNRKIFTPLRAYLLGTLMLVLLVSSPFTIGRGVALACDDIVNTGDAIADLYCALVSWSDVHALTSWFIAGYVGFNTGCLMLRLRFKKMKARAGVVATVIAALLGLGASETMYAATPSISSLFNAFGAAGGTPDWLNCIATGVVVLCANAPHVGIAILVVSAFLFAVENSNK